MFTFDVHRYINNNLILLCKKLIFRLNEIVYLVRKINIYEIYLIIVKKFLKQK